MLTYSWCGMVLVPALTGISWGLAASSILVFLSFAVLCFTVWPCLFGPLGSLCGQQLFQCSLCMCLALLSVWGIFVNHMFLVFPLPPLPIALVFH